jgi:hypothetical protein
MKPAHRITESLGTTLRRERTEAAMLRTFGDHVGARFSPKSLPLPSGGYLEIDGFSVSPAVLCQVHAEVGTPTVEHKQVAMFDILKLNHAANVLGNTSRRVLLFRDQATAHRICAAPEVANELDDSGIEVCIAAA